MITLTVGPPGTPVPTEPAALSRFPTRTVAVTPHPSRSHHHSLIQPRTAFDVNVAKIRWSADAKGQGRSRREPPRPRQEGLWTGRSRTARSTQIHCRTTGNGTRIIAAWPFPRQGRYTALEVDRVQARQPDGRGRKESKPAWTMGAHATGTFVAAFPAVTRTGAVLAHRTIPAGPGPTGAAARPPPPVRPRRGGTPPRWAQARPASRHA